MADVVHHQSRGASGQSLDRLFNELRDLRERQDDCEAVIRTASNRRAQENARLEQLLKDALAAFLALKEAEHEAAAGQEPAPVAVGEDSRPGRPTLRLIIGGLAVIVTASAVLAQPAAEAVSGKIGHRGPAMVAPCYVRDTGCVSHDSDPRMPGIQYGERA